MTDILTWSINLGRWSGVQIRVHYFLIIFAVGKLFNAVIYADQHVLPTLAWLTIFLVVLTLHELAHATMAMIQRVEPDDVRLWPLGNLIIPSGATRSNENLAVAISGVAASGFLAIFSAMILAMAGARMVFNPFGDGPDAGAPYYSVAGFPRVGPSSPLWVVGWFGYLNLVIFLANLIPALPLDNGRVLRIILSRSSVGITRDNPYAQWTGHAIALILVLAGFVRMFRTDGFWDGITLFSLAFLIELCVRSETLIMEDGGFFDDGVFGYDFSEGYTSLESSAAKVRPYRESALKRWRRKRSELRKQRRLAREAAEERRMDEILEKLHIQGKGSLSDEENRFLIRVSTKLRNRPRS